MTEPALYVGTYAKYNNGNLTGDWLVLSDYLDQNEFEAACLELHQDEQDPEIMFQDCEAIPNQWYFESGLHSDLFDFVRLPLHERLAALEFFNEIALDGVMSDFQDSFVGQYSSWGDFVNEQLDESGIMESIPEPARPYFDYETYSKDLRLKFKMTDSGFVFIV